MEKHIPYKFDIHFDGELIPTSDPELYQSKVRVFYKYRNRNQAYITDEFAEQLALSAYAKPIVGTYDHYYQDFKGHEKAETQKGYGFVVPGSLTWEDHLDDDEVVRTYATYDVILWAEYWEEAKSIPLKTQSMELDPKTIRGDWQFIDDMDEEEYYVYSDGVMAGLCVLGDMKTPAFEGAAFFSMEDEGYKKFSLAIKNLYGGKDKMKVNVLGFEHVDSEKIWDALNPKFSEEGAYSLEEVPMQFEEENKLLYTYVCNTPGTVRVYNYLESEEGNLTLEEKESMNCFTLASELSKSIEANAAQTATLESLQADYTTLSSEKETLVADYEALKNQFEELTVKMAELTASAGQVQESYEAAIANNNTLTEENANLNAALATKTTEAETLVNDNFTLSEKLKKFEEAEKNRLVATFSKSLSDEAMKPILDKRDELTYEEMKSLLSIEYANFSLKEEEAEPFRFPKTNENEPKLYTILNKYKKS